jgi:hypothetical protein
MGFGLLKKKRLVSGNSSGGSNHVGDYSQRKHRTTDHTEGTTMEDFSFDGDECNSTPKVVVTGCKKGGVHSVVVVPKTTMVELQHEVLEKSNQCSILKENLTTLSVQMKRQESQIQSQLAAIQEQNAVLAAKAAEADEWKKRYEQFVSGSTNEALVAPVSLPSPALLAPLDPLLGQVSVDQPLVPPSRQASSELTPVGRSRAIPTRHSSALFLPMSMYTERHDDRDEEDSIDYPYGNVPPVTTTTDELDQAIASPHSPSRLQRLSPLRRKAPIRSKSANGGGGGGARGGGARGGGFKSIKSLLSIQPMFHFRDDKNDDDRVTTPTPGQGSSTTITSDSNHSSTEDSEPITDDNTKQQQHQAAAAAAAAVANVFDTMALELLDHATVPGCGFPEIADSVDRHHQGDEEHFTNEAADKTQEEREITLNPPTESLDTMAKELASRSVLQNGKEDESMFALGQAYVTLGEFMAHRQALLKKHAAEGTPLPEIDRSWSAFIETVAPGSSSLDLSISDLSFDSEDSFDDDYEECAAATGKPAPPEKSHADRLRSRVLRAAKREARRAHFTIEKVEC